MKFRVQSYDQTSLWKIKALPFLKREEGWNNLFWQIIQAREKFFQEGWAANVFCEGKISLSALHTPSKYLLISYGSLRAVEALAKYSLRQKWELHGISGPEDMVNFLLDCRGEKGRKSWGYTPRVFKLFQTTNLSKKARFKDYKLAPVSNIDWPKARIWAQKFAMEADPPMNLSAITQLAKQMHSEKNLFMLSDPQNHPCAMAGFGRSTDRYRVINMVYVPQDMRRQGIGKELITRMALYAKELRYSACLLFSERKEAGNLYDTMGCKALGKFVEYGLV